MARYPTSDYSPVNSVSPSATPNNYLNVRASPDDFGANIGRSLEKTGTVIDELEEKAKPYRYDKTAEDLLQMSATEAKANDLIANKWAPATEQLKDSFDQTEGADKIAAADGYIGGLHNARAELLKTASTPYEQEIIGGYTNKYIEHETNSARSLADQAFTQFQDKAHDQKLMVDANTAINNYNDPAVVDSTFQMMNAQIEKHGLDRDWAPEQIEDAQRQQAAYTYSSMVDRAVKVGDINTATQIYSKNQYLIPGPQRMELEQKLHSVSLVQYSRQASEALVMGHPVPSPMNKPEILQVKAAVANDAQARGLDPNVALTFSRIESYHGQNTGKRGDIGQTGKGGDIQEQIANMNMEIQKSASVATKALGREPEPWEVYMCYQQGQGGGPALLKAASDPTARAIDVLTPLYGSSKIATQAIVNNGGNANMTAGQFLDFWKDNYNRNAQREMCEIPPEGIASVQNPVAGTDIATEISPRKMGDAILAPTDQIGVPLQQGYTPVQTLSNFNKVMPDALMRANQIPNLQERYGVIKALEQKQAIYQSAAGAWKQQFQLQAQQLAVNPSFTSLDQIPPDMMTALMDSPATLTWMEGRAKANLEAVGGIVGKEAKEYGTGFNDAIQGVWTQKINSVDEVHQLYKDGAITLSGVDRLQKELAGESKPENASEKMMKDQAFKAIKANLSGADDMLGIKDPKGELLYSQFLQKALPAYDDARAKGINPAQLLDPTSKDYIGQYATPLKRTLEQQTADMMYDAPSTAAERTLQAIITDVQNGKLKPEQGKSEALKLGYIRNVPTVPTGQ